MVHRFHLRPTTLLLQVHLAAKIMHQNLDHNRPQLQSKCFIIFVPGVLQVQRGTYQQRFDYRIPLSYLGGTVRPRVDVINKIFNIVTMLS